MEKVTREVGRYGRRSVGTVRLVAAFAAVYLIWGSTYLAIRYAVETIPPFLMMGVRSLVAGCILLGIGALRARRLPTRREWAFAGLVGAFLFLGGHGVLGWAERRVPSGSAALVIATVPVWLVVLDWLRPGGRAARVREIVGSGVGVLGVAALVVPVRAGGWMGIDAVGAAALVLAALSWSIGSLLSRSDRLPGSAFLRTGTALVTGGVALLAFAGFIGEIGALDVTRVSPRSVVSLVYLIVFGSLIAFTCYIWLLRVASPARVGSYAFVNPVVAVLIGWGVGGESVSPRVLASGILILGGVWLVNVRTRKRDGTSLDPGDDDSDRLRERSDGERGMSGRPKGGRLAGERP